MVPKDSRDNHQEKVHFGGQEYFRKSLVFPNFPHLHRHTFKMMIQPILTQFSNTKMRQQFFASLLSQHQSLCSWQPFWDSSGKSTKVQDSRVTCWTPLPFCTTRSQKTNSLLNKNKKAWKLITAGTVSRVDLSQALVDKLHCQATGGHSNFVQRWPRNDLNT